AVSAGSADAAGSGDAATSGDVADAWRSSVISSSPASSTASSRSGGTSRRLPSSASGDVVVGAEAGRTGLVRAPLVAGTTAGAPACVVVGTAPWTRGARPGSSRSFSTSFVVIVVLRSHPHDRRGVRPRSSSRTCRRCVREEWRVAGRLLDPCQGYPDPRVGVGWGRDPGPAPPWDTGPGRGGAQDSIA